MFAFDALARFDSDEAAEGRLECRTTITGVRRLRQNMISTTRERTKILLTETLLPGKKVILLAVAVTKVKCIYCCKFFTSWYHFMDNNNKS